MINNKRILIADDEPNMVRSLGFVLSKEGYEVINAVDGEDAISKARETRPALVFLDIMMPRKNGYEVCRELRASPETCGTYVIVLSAKGWELDKEKALEMGANEFVSKPFSPMFLVSRVKEILK